MSPQQILTLFLVVAPIAAAINIDVLSSVGENVIVELSAVTIGGWFFGHAIDSYFNNPLGWMIKWTIYGAVATGLYLWLFSNFFEEHRVERDNTGTYMHWVIRWYTALPWNVLSRFYGYYSKIPIPRPLRRLVYGRYAKIHGANMEEAEKPYEAYPTFGKWFNRNLKPGIRPISDAPVVSPADGIIIHYGQVEDGDKIVYVKGQDFSVEEFLGPIKVHRKKDKRLYQVCVFLTSGSYHNFHSPTKWTLKNIFHHPGDLFKVRPGYINYIPRVFCVNERVSICGEWEHGFMSLTPVAATYVGDIVIDVESPSHPILEHGNQTVPYKEYHLNHNLVPGEKIGQFRSGSVNVLIFEGPPDLKFAIKPGQKINYGQPIVELTD